MISAGGVVFITIVVVVVALLLGSVGFVEGKTEDENEDSGGETQQCNTSNRCEGQSNQNNDDGEKARRDFFS